MSEWGPWIEHDGKGCPVKNGVIVHCVYNTGEERIVAVSANGFPDIDNAWVFREDMESIIRYRIRKPKGMKILESLLENLPEEIEA